MLLCAAMTACSLAVNAQEAKNEVYMNNSLMSLSAYNKPDENREGDCFKRLRMTMWTVGYNRFVDLSEQMPLQMTVGAKFMYGRVNDGNFGLTHRGEGSGQDVDEMIRFCVPANLKLAFPVVGKFAVEPYAGLNASVISNDTGFGGNKLNFGWQCGLDFSLSKFVVGVSYTNDFFRYTDVEVNSVNKSAYWSSLDFKLGYRF